MKCKWGGIPCDNEATVQLGHLIFNDRPPAWMPTEVRCTHHAIQTVEGIAERDRTALAFRPMPKEVEDEQADDRDGESAGEG